MTLMMCNGVLRGGVKLGPDAVGTEMVVTLPYFHRGVVEAVATVARAVVVL